MTPSTIKYHINLPVDTTKYSRASAQAAVQTALAIYNIASIDTFLPTLGAAGWRVSVVFNPPFPASASPVVYDVEQEVQSLAWPLEGPITAWIHP